MATSMLESKTNEIMIVTVIASPKPAPHGVQGEGRGNLVFTWDCLVVPRSAGLLAMARSFSCFELVSPGDLLDSYPRFF
jgi:hypothetical protein